jgi:hypothetical protein
VFVILATITPVQAIENTVLKDPHATLTTHVKKMFAPLRTKLRPVVLSKNAVTLVNAKKPLVPQRTKILFVPTQTTVTRQTSSVHLATTPIKFAPMENDANLEASACPMNAQTIQNVRA